MRTIITLATAVALFTTPVGAAWAQTAPPATEVVPETGAVAPETPASTTLPEAAPAAPAASGPIVTYTVRPGPPTFVMSTAAKATFAMIGAFAMIAEGKRLAAELKLEEPANAVGAEVAVAYAASKGGQVATEPLAISAPKQDLIVSNAGKAAYIVDVSPVGMNAIYFPSDWTHYGLIYNTFVRVFDASSGKVIASAKCHVKPKKAPESPDYDELIGENGAGLRKLIADANASCVTQLKTGLGL